jgi:putative endonuclease
MDQSKWIKSLSRMKHWVPRPTASRGRGFPYGLQLQCQMGQTNPKKASPIAGLFLCMAVFVYVLQSLADSTFYTGMTESLDRRLEEHNSGKSKFTSGHMPWKLIYFEEVMDFIEGRKREKYLKSAAGRRFILKWINQNGSSPFHG